ncbi:MAG: UDP-N-acetylglucosamine 2-epimerase (non-hydrolyzing) [Desulfomicrobium apsheronum]|nr:UDP-N-acetylglucosamine 2-epimerase (non-hydrolyzing) [Desulfomicrobium apsheronum]
MKKVLIIVGTRPEAIKMAPVVHALRQRPKDFTVHLCSSGQHQQMLEQTFADFNLKPDSSLDVMTNNQSLAMLSANLFIAVDDLLQKIAPDVVLVQGDTTTAQVSALCAFYKGIFVGHVEAGLRTWDKLSPFPEEINRRIIGLVAQWHYAPTHMSLQNLLTEHINSDSILVTGNTAVDALLMVIESARSNPPLLPSRVKSALDEGRPLILITGHRRESFGRRLRNICMALAEIANAAPQARIVYPVHLNPNVREPVYSMLGTHPNIFLLDPQPYKSFVYLMDKSTLILTDSGGIQEEGPYLNKPVLIMRDVTERPEGINTGSNRLVGTNVASIVRESLSILREPKNTKKNADTDNPYGDGKAAQRIAKHLASQNI